MRTLLPLLAAALLTALVQPAAAADNPTWSPPLTSGSGVGVALQDGVARPIDQRTAFRAPREDVAAEGTPDTAVATGLLTLDPHRLASPTNRSSPASPPGSPQGATADVDVRGLRANGNWSEWIPADDGVAVLPEPVSTCRPASSSPATRPGGHGLTLTALASVQLEGARAEGNPLRYQIFATREGLVGGTTANGHVITPHDRFVALPSRRALSPNGSSDYSVRICAPNGRCAFAPVWTSARGTSRTTTGTRTASSGATSRRAPRRPRSPSGRATTAARTGSTARSPTRRASTSPTAPSGTTSGLINNTTVTVDYLWTGNVRLAKVVDTGPVYAAPARDADVVGTAAQREASPSSASRRAGCGSASGSSSPPRRSRPPARSGDANPRRARGDLRRDGCCAPDHADRLRAPLTCAAAVRATSPCGSTDPSS